MTDTDTRDLLAVLEAQGAQFLKSFGAIEYKRKPPAKDDGFIQDVKARQVEEDTEDEWTGFGSDSAEHTDIEMSPPNNEKSASTSRTPQVVVFAEGTSNHSTLQLQSRAFMSSKVSKLKESTTESSDLKEFHDDDGEGDDLSNIQNDALLHKLVHTKLLSGSLNPSLDMTPAQRRKALAGRVLELTGDSKLGKGEAVVRQDEKNKASKRVREGIMARKRQRDINHLEEAKNAGNFHPAVKKLFEGSSFDSKPRKRDRGLKMGVGRFSAGMLKLTPEDIDRVRDIRSPHGYDRGSGRGNNRVRRGVERKTGKKR